MDKLDLIFQEIVFSRNKNLYVVYTATMEHPKIGEKSDVIAVSMTTMTFQYGGYLSSIVAVYMTYKFLFLEKLNLFLFSKVKSNLSILNTFTNCMEPP